MPVNVFLFDLTFLQICIIYKIIEPFPELFKLEENNDLFTWFPVFGV